MQVDKLTVELMSSLGLDELISSAAEAKCSAFGSVLRIAMDEEARWAPEQLNGLRFAHAVLMMTLRASNASEPYGALFVMDTGRSAVPADFPKQFLLNLGGWAKNLVDPELRARFLDVIWVQGKSFEAAKGAIEAYIQSAQRLNDPADWHQHAERVQRSLRIAASLGKGGIEFKTRILEQMQQDVNAGEGKAPDQLVNRFIGLLLEFKHGDLSLLAQVATAVAERAQTVGNFWGAKDYFERAAACFAAAGDESQQAVAQTRAAEALVQEAELAASQKVPGRGAMAAASILAQAIEAVRQIVGGKTRAAELHSRLLQLQEMTRAEMQTISTESDASKLVQQARDAVRGACAFKEAVFILCRLASPTSLDELRTLVRQEAEVGVLHSIADTSVLNARGKVVAKVPALSAPEVGLEDQGMRFRMYRHAKVTRDFYVQAILNPARQEIKDLYLPSQEEVLSLVRHSPWIAPGHHQSVVRALVAGFEGDMLVAGHMIAPQFEALIRNVVELAGGTTSMLDPEGLQPEKSLNVLLDMPELKKVFGEAAIFEMQDIFVDQIGANVRNDVAHGLLQDSQLFTVDVFYSWWLLLRYCVLSSAIAMEQV